LMRSSRQHRSIESGSFGSFIYESFVKVAARMTDQGNLF
jgi:hypothetical protein